ncbi:osmoprotectant ABC transporter substrate-binding protein [uncultured Lacticaseibacillus sp.]|uniref:osmoprotectant ABC transporter substrate-binding protein n=1 Tax=uncultured Lacticaseibacillus sp. TaxID=2775882 RepID=UPI002599BEF6|nr:osmoprotectant ABC transporter substrate-binding protein [uncultured Lacticaseibacillus sp.]
MRKLWRQLLLLVCGCLLLAGCAGSGITTAGQPTIRIAAMSSTESQIMANMVAELINHELDYKTEIVGNLGSTTVVHQALIRGDADIAASRYTGTDLTGTLMKEPQKDPTQALRTVQREFKDRYNQTWFPSYGFANTYAFMVSKQTAARDHLKKVSDLQRVAGKMNAGVDSSWMNRKGDGYQDFVKTYGFDFQRVYPMQIGLVYDAVAAGKMQTVLGYSTDGRIRSYDLTVLRDDRQFFPPYDCSMVVNDSLLKAHPKLKALLHRLDGQINVRTMQQLNYEVDDQLLEPAVVAERFLSRHHYFRGGE